MNKKDSRNSNNLINCIFANNRKVVIPFITAGYPRLTSTLPILVELAQKAKIIEIGIPFSDPMADGPVIEAANNVAINNGVNINWILEIICQFRRINNKSAIVLMGYQNSFEQYAKGNINKFIKDAKNAGVNGILIVDSPFEESNDLFIFATNQNIAMIRLIAPTTPITRIKKIAKSSCGYLYYVSLKGVTGSKKININEVKKQVNILRKHQNLPIAVGFGISNASQVKKILTFSDAVVIGSQLIKIINKNLSKSDKEISKIVGSFISKLF